MDHSKAYSHPDDSSVDTNKIEGLWNCIKRWLPTSGRYNLEQFPYLYLWLNNHKCNGTDPFWALVELVRKNNSIDALEAALEVDDDTDGVDFIHEEDIIHDSEEQCILDDNTENTEYETEADLFPCPFCCELRTSKVDSLNHIESCKKQFFNDDK